MRGCLRLTAKYDWEDEPAELQDWGKKIPRVDVGQWLLRAVKDLEGEKARAPVSLSLSGARTRGNSRLGARRRWWR